MWGGECDIELRLLENGTVVFQPIDDQQARGAPHGNWFYDENGAIIVAFDCLARPDQIKTHVFKKLNNLTNAYTLSNRDGYDIPNPHHKYRALLIHNCCKRD